MIIITNIKFVPALSIVSQKSHKSLHLFDFIKNPTKLSFLLGFSIGIFFVISYTYDLNETKQAIITKTHLELLCISQRVSH